jgi:hypothetical protein
MELRYLPIENKMKSDFLTDFLEKTKEYDSINKKIYYFTIPSGL